MHLRNSVLWYAQRMEANLRAHDDRDHWSGVEVMDLFRHLEDELRELKEELDRFPWDRDRVINEAADVGNIAMMVADNMGRILTRPPAAPE